jgi:hypothetical protein
LTLRLAKAPGTKHIIFYYGVTTDPFGYASLQQTAAYEENREQYSAQSVSKKYTASFARALEEAQADFELPVGERMRAKRKPCKAPKKKVPTAVSDDGAAVPVSKKRAAPESEGSAEGEAKPAAKKKRVAPKKAKPVSKAKAPPAPAAEEKEEVVFEEEEEEEDDEEEAEFDGNVDDEDDYVPDKKKKEEAKKKKASIQHPPTRPSCLPSSCVFAYLSGVSDCAVT